MFQKPSSKLRQSLSSLMNALEQKTVDNIRSLTIDI